MILLSCSYVLLTAQWALDGDQITMSGFEFGIFVHTGCFFMDEPVFFSLMGKTSSSSFLIPFGSGLEAPSMHPIFLSRRGTIYEEDKFYWSLMICDLIIFSNCNCLS